MRGKESNNMSLILEVLAVELVLALVVCFCLYQIYENELQHNQYIEAKENSLTRRVTDTNVSFPYAGDAGAVTLEFGNYTAALQSGKANNDAGQQIVDADYEALLAEVGTYSDGKLSGGKIKSILDHNFGIPALMPGIMDSNFMWLKNPNGTIYKYRKTSTVHTGNRATEDFITTDGTDTLSDAYIDSVCNRETDILFVTCEQDGRLLTFWTPVSEEKDQS